MPKLLILDAESADPNQWCEAQWLRRTCLVTLSLFLLSLDFAHSAEDAPRRPLEMIPVNPLDTDSAWGNRLQVHPKGGFLVSVSGGFPDSVIRLDAQGHRVWGRQVPAESVAALPGGGALAVGVQPAPGVDYVAALNWISEEGTLEKEILLDLGVPLPREGGYCVCSSAHQTAPASDGGFLVVGASTLGPGHGKNSLPLGGIDGWVVRVDAEGNPLWEQTYGSKGYDLLERAAVLPDGGWMLAGLTASPYFTMLLIRTDSTGNVVFQKLVGPGTLTRHTWFQDMIVTSDGDVLMTGFVAGSFEARSVLVVRLNLSGNEVWSRSFKSSGNTVPQGVIELANGDLLLTGSSSSRAVSTWFRCLSRDGQVRWETRLPNHGSDFYRVTQASPLPDGRMAWVTQRQGKLLFGFMEPPLVPAAGERLTLTALPEFFPSHPEGYYSLNGPSQTRFVVERSFDLITWTQMFTNIIGATDFQFAPAGNPPGIQFYRAKGLD